MEPAIEFIRFLALAFYGKEKEIIDYDRLLNVLENIRDNDFEGLMQIMIQAGVIFFMLYRIFD